MLSNLVCTATSVASTAESSISPQEDGEFRDELCEQADGYESRGAAFATGLCVPCLGWLGPVRKGPVDKG